LQDYAEENAFKDESYLAIIQNPEAGAEDNESFQETRHRAYEPRDKPEINDFEQVQNLQGVMPDALYGIPEQENSFYEEVIEEIRTRQ
jgi:hypothetical protein